jgi:hypothetical protein
MSLTDLCAAVCSASQLLPAGHSRCCFLRHLTQQQQQLLRQARRAVNELAMSLDGAEADACFAAARNAVMPLLRHADTSCASSAKALLLGVYDAVYAGGQHACRCCGAAAQVTV